MQIRKTKQDYFIMRYLERIPHEVSSVPLSTSRPQILHLWIFHIIYDSAVYASRYKKCSSNYGPRTNLRFLRTHI
jgi:hypothetical protein